MMLMIFELCTTASNTHLFSTYFYKIHNAEHVQRVAQTNPVAETEVVHGRKGTTGGGALGNVRLTSAGCEMSV